MLDPLTHAVRRDIADIRLAEHVFAPHYVAPMERRIAVATVLCGDRDDGAVPIATLSKGDRFDVLDISGATAWGIAVKAGLVGYVAIAAIEGLSV
ncbi:SH3 domain-containing protein [Sphingomonas bacterium]|uniref:SH3 domain-containing protein n=1 Tax=Sphingomonas bacterium TaxID=1895847 RepID=UPI001575FE0E|nr:SH3 domain-containing protein [Sphingomonas bacterium]